MAGISGLKGKRAISLILSVVLGLGLSVLTYGAETTTTTTAPANTTTAATRTGTAPYTSTTTKIGNLDPRLGDSAINASNASKVNAVGEPHSVGGYTKNQLYTMRASQVLELLTGEYGVYDKTGHRLGTAKEMFNGVWDDIDPAAVMGLQGGNPVNRGKPYNTNPGNYEMKSVSKAWIKLDIPSNGYYAKIENIPGNSGGKLVELKTLTVKKWNYAARYCEIYDKDKKRITFTRESGETY